MKTLHNYLSKFTILMVNFINKFKLISKRSFPSDKHMRWRLRETNSGFMLSVNLQKREIINEGKGYIFYLY